MGLSADREKSFTRDLADPTVRPVIFVGFVYDNMIESGIYDHQSNTFARLVQDETDETRDKWAMYCSGPLHQACLDTIATFTGLLPDGPDMQKVKFPPWARHSREKSH